MTRELTVGLRLYRELIGLTRSEMAKRFGVSCGRYGEVEDGIRDISKAMIREGYRSGIPAALLLAPSVHEGKDDE